MSTLSTPPKDPNTAMVIEIVAGYLGFLGIGYLYAGRTAAGLLRLFGWWAFLILVVVGATGLSTLPLLAVFANPADIESGLETALGAGFSSILCLLCLIPIMLVVPVISGLMLKHSLEG